EVGDGVRAAGVEHVLAGRDVGGVDVLVARPRGGGWHAALDHERAAGVQVAGGVLEAADLVVLGEQVADGVVDEVDQPVAPPGGGPGHVAGCHLDGVAAGLFAHPVYHVRGQLDAVHAHARSGERQGDAAGTHRELQYVTPAG